MTTEIIPQLRLLDKESVVKAVGDVTITTDLGEITIVGVKVIQMDGKSPWVAYPQTEYERKDSKEKVRKNVVDLGHRLDKAIKDAVLNQFAELTGHATQL